MAKISEIYRNQVCYKSVCIWNLHFNIFASLLYFVYGLNAFLAPLKVKYLHSIYFTIFNPMFVCNFKIQTKISCQLVYIEKVFLEEKAISYLCICIFSTKFIKPSVDLWIQICIKVQVVLIAVILKMQVVNASTATCSFLSSKKFLQIVGSRGNFA